MNDITTWKEAEVRLAMLTFDLGQSSNTIKDCFDAGLFLRYSKIMNFWYWTTFTCTDCAINKECEFAFDAYNKDGDCLANK